MQHGSNSLDDYSKNLRRLFWVQFIEQQLDQRYIENLRRAAAAAVEPAEPVAADSGPAGPRATRGR